jgi:hypothetical protein
VQLVALTVARRAKDLPTRKREAKANNLEKCCGSLKIK